MKKITKIRTLFIATLLPAMFAVNVNALDCSAEVLSIRIMKGGTLELKFAGDVNQSYANICNVSATINGVHPEVCKSWVSLALTAKSTGKELKLWDVQGGACFTGGNLMIEKLSVAKNG